MKESPTDSGPDRIYWLRRALDLVDVDRAVFFAVALRAWQLAGGTISALLIALFFTPALQGYYYTIVNLLALQTFFELGFSIVITNVSSHEWARLHLGSRGEIVGDPGALSRLVSLGRLVFRWYAVACFAFMFIVGLAGAAFLSHRAESTTGWSAPWILVVVATGLLLWTQPFGALLEGCNQVATVYRFRLIQAIVANLAVWSVVAAGRGLWALVAAAVARFACDAYLLGVHFRSFFRSFVHSANGPQISWGAEVWPMQWRLALGGVFHYFSYNLFTPVMFYYHGPEVAGRMGMTCALVTALQAATLAWVQTRVPRMGMLISQRRFNDLDQLYRRIAIISLVLVALGGAALWAMVYALNHFQSPFSERLLPPGPVALLLLATIIYQLPHCQAFYLRAHKREVLLIPSILTGAAIGTLVWMWGCSPYGPMGATAAYLAVVVLFTLPCHTYLWIRYRRRWHEKRAG